MRISDWSSDVCSSDLVEAPEVGCIRDGFVDRRPHALVDVLGLIADEILHRAEQIGHSRRLEQHIHRAVHQTLQAGQVREGSAAASERTIGRAFVDPSSTTTAEPGISELVTEGDLRSAEHTSELQSLMRNSYAVSCMKEK